MRFLIFARALAAFTFIFCVLGGLIAVVLFIGGRGVHALAYAVLDFVLAAVNYRLYRLNDDAIKVERRRQQRAQQNQTQVYYGRRSNW